MESLESTILYSTEGVSIYHMSSISSALCLICQDSITTIDSASGLILDQLPLDEQITAVSWSPDGAVGILVTGNKALHFITPNLELLMDVNLEQEGFGQATPVTVGWGKKETQFHGSAGKTAAQKKADAPTAVAMWDSVRVYITWEANGQAFAVSWVVENNEGVRYRQIRVFTMDGELYSTAETCPNLEEGLAWRPNSHLIAASDRSPHGLRVIFFERNGLRHGEFIVLPSKTNAPSSGDHWWSHVEAVHINELSFNTEGTVLAVHLVPNSSANSNLDIPAAGIVRLYTTDNYHWYGKCDLSYDNCDSLLSIWSPVNAMDLCTISLHKNPEKSHPATIHSYSWYPLVDAYGDLSLCEKSPQPTERESALPGLVAVIDTDTILFNPFSRLVVPPPMCAFSLRFSGTFSSIAYLSLPFWSPWQTVSTILTEEKHYNTSLLVQLCGSASLYLVKINDMSHSEDGIIANCSTAKDEWQMLPVTKNEDTPPGQEKYMCNVYLRCHTGSRSGFRNVGFPLPHTVESLPGLGHSQEKLEFIQHCEWISPTDFLIQIGNSVWRYTSTHQENGSSHWCLREVFHTTSGLYSFALGPQNSFYVLFKDGKIDVYCLKETPISSVHLRTLPNHFPDPSAGPLRLVWLKDYSTNNQLETIPVVIYYLNSRTYKLSVMVDSQTSSSTIQLPDAPISADGERSRCGAFTGITSVAVHPEFLLFTTLQRQLIVVSLHCDSTEFMQQLRYSLQCQQSVSGPAQPASTSYCETIRAIEQGGQFITVVPNQCKVILFMPRGNLETIYPRSLVLSVLRDLLDRREYKQCVDLARRHRVNMNILYDHNPTLFLNNIKHFITDVADSERINLFVADLSGEDVTQRMYSKFYARKNGHLPNQKVTLIDENDNGKVDKVCDALVEAMKCLDEKKYLLCILTCLVKKSKEDSQKALLLAKKYRDAGDDSTWEKCLHHLRYLVDVQTLYKLALGTYDLNLALAVAERSQMDPCEYVSHLKELEECSLLLYRHYLIELHLRQYGRALDHLTKLCLEEISQGNEHGKCGGRHFEECLKLMKEHHLFSQALHSFPVGSEERKCICEAFANWLIQQKRLADAATIYEYGGLHQMAASCYARLNDWQHWFSCTLLQQSMECSEVLSEETKSQARAMADRLTTLGRYQESCDILIEVLKVPEEAVQLHLDNFAWSAAKLINVKYSILNHEEFTEKLCTKLIEQYEHLEEEIRKNLQTFTSHAQRICQLREQHKNAYLRRMETFDGTMGLADGTDLFSDTSSVFSGSTLSLASGASDASGSSKTSGRSAKTRRKAERKKWTTREGSSNEEIALLQESHTLIMNAQKLAEQSTEVVNMLAVHGKVEEGRHLLSMVNKLLETQKRFLPVLWDDFITGVDIYQRFQLPLTTANHEYAGRKFYEFHETFLRFAPEMKTLKVNSHLM